MCTGLFLEWALRHDATTERDNRWQHLKPRNQSGLTVLLWLSLFSFSPSINLFLLHISAVEPNSDWVLSHKESEVCVSSSQHIKDQTGQFEMINWLNLCFSSLYVCLNTVKASNEGWEDNGDQIDKGWGSGVMQPHASRNRVQHYIHTTCSMFIKYDVLLWAVYRSQQGAVECSCTPDTKRKTKSTNYYLSCYLCVCVSILI